jgi:ABC-type transport system substrate-binding protein
VDRQAIADVVWGGIVSPATGGFVPPGMPGHSPGIGLGYDPPKARRLLAEAGYPNGRGFPAIDVVAPSQGLARRSEQYVQAQWRDNLGIHVTWEWLDWLAYKERLRTSAPHLHVMGWIADYPDPDTALRVAMHQPYCRWHNEQYERTLESARRITDEAERTKFYRAADRLLIEEAAILPLFHGRYHQLVKPWVKRFPISPIGASYWEEVIIEGH